MSEPTLPDSPAERWLRLADEDLEAARVILASSSSPRVACFLAQQAAEKALKAGLIGRGRDFPKVHALTGLLALYPEAERPDAKEDDLDTLDPLVIDGRYAADLPPVDTEEARKLLVIAERVVRAVRDALPRSAGK